MKITYEEFKELKKNFDEFSKVRILTPSMAPLILVNDMVVVSPLPKDLNKIEPFDILVFWQKDKLICHFFIKNENGIYITRGLNNKYNDEPVQEDHLYGIVIKPKVGRIKRFFLKFFMR